MVGDSRNYSVISHIEVNFPLSGWEARNGDIMVCFNTIKFSGTKIFSSMYTMWLVADNTGIMKNFVLVSQGTSVSCACWTLTT